eukprot:CAMPEP_0119121818 /NCGR_PEP_ID=MMETSP1310-20130426/2269_1 /TAXON_ID=464262 /ORGANISM="Genus nov. species nov., Strain RCC2339" /LENGTH=81 /DNA_ID=CAMNT_0007111399 /DNA_START=90 /DNA_END=335 /DNA_ORIENTATION=+
MAKKVAALFDARRTATIARGKLRHCRIKRQVRLESIHTLNAILAVYLRSLLERLVRQTKITEEREEMGDEIPRNFHPMLFQ